MVKLEFDIVVLCFCFKALSTSTFSPQRSRCAFFHCIAKSFHHLLGFIIHWQRVLSLVSFFAAGRTAKGSNSLIFTDGTTISSRHLRFNLEAKSLFFPLSYFFLFFSFSCCSGCCSESPALRDTQEMTAWKSTHTLRHILSHTHSIQPLQKQPS